MGLVDDSVALDGPERRGNLGLVLDRRSILDNNCSVMIDREGAPTTARVLARRAVETDPRNLAAWANYGVCAFRAGLLDEAERAAHRLVAGGTSCSVSEGHRLFGMALAARGGPGDLEGSLFHFDKAMLAAAPGDAERMVDVGYAHMKLGDYATGFPLYQAACRALCDYDRPPGIPRWKGEPGADLLVVTDQGHGDQVMCSRFLPWAIERSRRVTVCVRPLEAALFAKLEGADVVLDWGATKFDYQINTTGLVEAYGCTIETIPPVVSYISDAVRPPPQVPVDGVKVGIAWTGNWHHLYTYFRDVPFLEMLRLAEDPRVHLYSFQCGPPSADISKHRAQRLVRDLSGQIEGEWSQTAALLKCMDVVVSADTGFVHVALTLGCHTCVLLPTYADWRWGTGETTPWYPRAKLFRQKRFLEWGPVIDDVKNHLSELIDSWKLKPDKKAEAA